MQMMTVRLDVACHLVVQSARPCSNPAWGLGEAGTNHMDKKEFFDIRARLGKTQAQMGALLRTSAKAVQSYEQGWRSIPAHAERQMLFLLSMKKGAAPQKPCWILKSCPPERRRACPAWEFRAGKLCWFINGTMCAGKPQRDWNKKMKICRSCEVMASLLTPRQSKDRHGSTHKAHP